MRSAANTAHRQAKNQSDGGLHAIETSDPRTRSAARLLVPVVPLVGAAIVAIASRSERLYRLLVQEDALLEWGQVVAYVCVVALAVVAVPRLWRRGAALSVTVLLGLALVSLVSAGEELSWGQRLLGFETPRIAENNRQGEFTLHNDARLEGPTRFGLLLTGLYGSLAPLVVRRRTALVPPGALVAWFAVVATYFSIRLLFIDDPTYVEAKYSEWPETCFAAALVLWCADISSMRTADERLGSR